jgi:hypothetical protein
MLRDSTTLKLFGVLVMCAAGATAAAEDWLPISSEELKMTSEPQAPTAPAIILYRQVDRDDQTYTELVYIRIKILTEEGRKYADIEIPFNDTYESVRGIQARTIRPDGSVVNFDGSVFEKPIIKGRGVKIMAKTFTLPDVQAGSIIEYRYRHNLQTGWVYDSHWILSEELFTKRAKFSLVQSEFYGLRYSWPSGLPSGTNPPKKEYGKIRLETQNVPAFITEDYMPPEGELQYHVDFIYEEGSLDKDPEKFWKNFAKQRYRKVDDFIDKRRVMEQAVAEIVTASDSSETKLRKIYARTQQIRNTTFERSKSQQEIDRENQKEAKDVADVWKRGYGDGLQIAWLYVALVRAAGLEADPVLVSTRNTYFFNKGVMNPYQLNSNVVLVKLDGKELYVDPGTPSTPFGLLPWIETGVQGLRLDKSGGSWVTTPLPPSSESRIVRKANFRMLPSGTLEGKVSVIYTGLEALRRRLEERNEDETDRKQFLENEIKYDIPTGIDVTLTNKPDWNSSDSAMVVEYDVKVPGWAAVAGQRALMPVGLFSQREKHTFEHTMRIHPLYFNFPYKAEDDIVIELPAGWQASSVPQPHTEDKKVVRYSVAAEEKNGALHLKRDLAVDLLFLDKKFYSQLRDFYQAVRTDDEEQVVFGPSKAAAKR